MFSSYRNSFIQGAPKIVLLGLSVLALSLPSIGRAYVDSDFGCTPTTFSGNVTWYDNSSGFAACHYADSVLPLGPGPSNSAYAAIATDLYSLNLCGACIEVRDSGNGKKVTVMITDECPVASNPKCGTNSNHIDLSPWAFNQLEAAAVGEFATTWRVVPCPLSYMNSRGQNGANLTYQFKSGASSGWATMIIKDYIMPIKTLEYCSGIGSGCSPATWQRSYNGWVPSGSWNTFYVRVTDKGGNVGNFGPITCCSPTGTDARSDPATVFANIPGGQMPGCGAASPTPTLTRTPTACVCSPTFTPTPTAAPADCPLLFNSCESLTANGTWSGANATRSIQVGGPSVTQGSSSMKVAITVAGTTYNTVAVLSGFAPTDWTPFTRLTADVYVDPAALPWNGGATYHQLDLQGAAASVAKYQQAITSGVVPLVAGMNNVSFSLTFPGTIVRGDPMSDLFFNLSIGAGGAAAIPGTIYIDNIVLHTDAICPPASPTSTVTRTSTPTSTRTNTPSPSSTWSGTATLTVTPTVTSSSTISPSFTSTQTPLPATFTSTRTATASSTSTGTASGTSTQTLSATATNTAVPPTLSSTATPTRTVTSTPSSSMSPSFTGTVTSTATASTTRTQTPTITISPTASNTPLPGSTWTDTSTVSPTSTGTSTRTPTYTSTVVVPSATSTSTVTPINTYTFTATSTPTGTFTNTVVLPSFTSTNTPLPGSTFTDTSTVTPTVTATATQTPLSSRTFTMTVTVIPPSSTPSNTPLPGSTFTYTRTVTPTSTPSVTTIVVTSTVSQTPTMTNTMPIVSATPTVTLTVSNSMTVSPTVSSTPTANTGGLPGEGTMTVSPNQVNAGATGQTFTFTYTALNAWTNGNLILSLPSGWPDPSLASYSPGFISATSNGSGLSLSFVGSGVAGWTFVVQMGSLPVSGNIVINYGSVALGGPGLTVPNLPGPNTFVAKTDPQGLSVAALSISPVVNVKGPTATSVPDDGPNDIEKHSVVPSPWDGSGTAYVMAKLAGHCDRLTLKVYTRALVCVGNQELGAQNSGWAKIAVPKEFQSQASNGTYFYIVTAERAGQKNLTKAVGKLVVLR